MQTNFASEDEVDSHRSHKASVVDSSSTAGTKFTSPQYY